MKVLFIILLLLIVRSEKIAGQIVNIEEQRITRTNDSVHWYGSLKTAFSFSRVQEPALQWSVESHVQYKKDKHLALLLLSYNLVKAGNEDYVNSAFAHLRYNYKLTNPLVLEGFTQLQTNKLLYIQTRLLFGTGLRRRFFLSSDERNRLYIGASCMWEQNNFVGESDLQSWYRFNSYISATFRFGKKFILTNTNYWQPVIGTIKNYRFLSDWTMILPITKRLGFTLDFTYTKEIGLPVDAPSYTIFWKNGLLWAL